VSVNYEQLEITSREQWRDWLAANHDRSAGVWLVTYKKREGARHVPRDAVVDEALSFGWVDSLPRTLDGERTQLLLTPRKPRSKSSRVNKERVARLEAAGLLHPAGRAVIEAAKADGTWSALDDVEELTEPDDLRRALDAHLSARRYWDAFPRSTKRAILEWIGNAKTPATRAKRVSETVSSAAHNVRANQWRQRKRR
jgi:uncharacterized protein YdeI (YjbR/CyaY-like superfamily)